MSGSGMNQFFKWDLKETFQSPIEHESIPLSLQDGGSGRHSVRISSIDEMLVEMSPGLDKWRRNRSRSRSPRGFNHHNSIFEERRYINNNGIIYHPFETGRMPADGLLRAREAGKDIKGTSFQHGRKTNGFPCKYFALGNCWKGKDCRFSHHTQEYTSSHKLDYAERIGQISQSRNLSKTSLATEIPPIQSSVSSNKLLQISNISESLAQLFGNKDQLQQLHATLNPLKFIENMSQKQCEPRLDSLEQIKNENKKGEAGTDERKKKLDEKRRALKFALVEFVKECLDPLWKESQIKKDDYKAIVKKVVDKVIGTVQGAQIPETKKHIDQYLSISKLKITKLIEAYVEKYQQMKKMEACS